MSAQAPLILALIFALALIQSLFGVGLLLFGTPLLLALGLSYEQTLIWLLPASAALSWSQVWELRAESLSHSYRRRFFSWCIPALLLSLHWHLSQPLRWLVLTMLCFSIGLRLHPVWFDRFKRLLARHLNAGLTLIGVVHGLSNMGGSLLTVLAAGLYAEKRQVLTAISLDYACMASAQLGLLLLLAPGLWQPGYLLGAALALSARYLLGSRLYALTGEGLYQQLITLLLTFNAGLLSWALLARH